MSCPECGKDTLVNVSREGGPTEFHCYECDYHGDGGDAMRPSGFHEMIQEAIRNRTKSINDALHEAMVGAKITRFEIELLKVPYASGFIVIIETDAKPVEILQDDGMIIRYDSNKLRWLVTPLGWKEEEKRPDGQDLAGL